MNFNLNIAFFLPVWAWIAAILALLVLLVLLFVYDCWKDYNAVMNLSRAEREAEAAGGVLPLYGLAKCVGVIALIKDFLLNTIIGTALFLDWPRERTLTKRLKRYNDDPNLKPWRRAILDWLRLKALDPYDPRGTHI